MAVTEDRRRIAVRLTVLQGCGVVVFTALTISFWVLQIAQHAKFQEMAENNHQRTLALRAPRGILYDRTGRVLVENRHAFTISIVREHTKDLAHTVRVLAQTVGLDPHEVQAIVDRHRSEPSYRPIVIVDDASLAQVAAVRARRLDFELPDVVVEEVPTRQYPSDELAAHLFGYVGEVNDAMVASDASLRTGDIVGQSGLEKTYNALLRGTDGAKRVVVNSLGREMSTLDEQPPTEGRRLQLTIDYDVQKAVEDAFKADNDAQLTNAGAAVVPDPRTGEAVGGWVVAKAGMTVDPDALRAHVGTRLARYKVPSRISVVDSLPRSHVPVPLGNPEPVIAVQSHSKTHTFTNSKTHTFEVGPPTLGGQMCVSWNVVGMSQASSQRVRVE